MAGLVIFLERRGPLGSGQHTRNHSSQYKTDSRIRYVLTTYPQQFLTIQNGFADQVSPHNISATIPHYTERVRGSGKSSQRTRNNSSLYRTGSRIRYVLTTYPQQFLTIQNGFADQVSPHNISATIPHYTERVRGSSKSSQHTRNHSSLYRTGSWIR